MNRFDCPWCGRSLRFRLLRHVPRDDQRFAFSCIHCGAVLEYTTEHLPLAEPFLRTRGRAPGTLLGGFVLFSGIGHFAGRAISMAAIGILAVALAVAYFFSKKPAFKVIVKSGEEDRGRSTDLTAG